jgi:hypothetical protein
MIRKVLILVAVTAISVFCLSGCKKSSSEAESDEEVPKTMAEYETEAKKQINKENMADELDRIEKALEEEVSQEQ